MIDLEKWKKNVAENTELKPAADELLTAYDALSKSLVAHGCTEQEAAKWIERLEEVSLAFQLDEFLMAMRKYTKIENDLVAESQS